MKITQSPREGSQPLLEINELTVHRNGRLVLHVSHLSVSTGETLAVIGPNGAGKSTLLLALARLIEPAQGKLTFHGQPLSSLRELEYRRRIGLVLQEPLLLDRSVLDNVSLGLRFRRVSPHLATKIAMEWLAKFGITHLASRPARHLSGGEAQRASLARALALKPEILLLDEPFSSLDSPTRLRLLEDFHALLAEASMTTIFVTHDLDEALYLGDRVAVLLNGNISQVGPPQQVFSAPVDRDVADLVGVETVIGGNVTASVDGLLEVDIGGQGLSVVGQAALGRPVLVCLRPEDITLWPQNNPPPSSARNQLRGQVQRLNPQGTLMRVVIDCGFPLVALITRTSAQELALQPGKPVMAAFKASAVHLIPR